MRAASTLERSRQPTARAALGRRAQAASPLSIRETQHFPHAGSSLLDDSRVFGVHLDSPRQAVIQALALERAHLRQAFLSNATDPHALPVVVLPGTPDAEGALRACGVRYARDRHTLSAAVDEDVALRVMGCSSDPELCQVRWIGPSDATVECLIVYLVQSGTLTLTVAHSLPPPAEGVPVSVLGESREHPSAHSDDLHGAAAGPGAGPSVLCACGSRATAAGRGA